jgi:hypothetical protein
MRRPANARSEQALVRTSPLVDSAGWQRVFQGRAGHQTRRRRLLEPFDDGRPSACSRPCMRRPANARSEQALVRTSPTWFSTCLFAFLRGTCQRGIYDNMETAVETIFVGREGAYNRTRATPAFAGAGS